MDMSLEGHHRDRSEIVRFILNVKMSDGLNKMSDVNI